LVAKSAILEKREAIECPKEKKRKMGRKEPKGRQYGKTALEVASPLGGKVKEARKRGPEDCKGKKTAWKKGG